MNFKRIVLMAAMISASANAFAIEIYKGKVISDKTWSDDGSKAVMKRDKMLLAKHGVPNSTYLNVLVRDLGGKVNEPVEIYNRHTKTVYNSSDVNHRYVIYEAVCAGVANSSSHCVIHAMKVELNPEGYFEDDSYPALEMTYSKPGRYNIYAFSSYREENEVDRYDDSSGAEGTITIT
jgi:hypothetical protein